jgi:release factor glutamine methyltransferase
MPEPLMQTIKQLLHDAQHQFTGSDSARLDAELLLAHTLCTDRSYLYAYPENTLSPEQQQCFAHYVQRRAQGEPLAYIIGKKEFCSLLLDVDDSTLIPRPDTETLVDVALQILPESPCTVLDLGTGTGAIALALAHERPAWDILAVDCEPRAVVLAQRNAQALGLARVRVMQSHWFAEISAHYFDLVISNPPYIDAGDVHLQQGDLRYEPHRALVSADHGLADIKQISVQARLHLKSGGHLMLEHGCQQGEAVRNILLHDNYQSVQTFCDLENRERVTIGHQP